ncbi:MAG: FecR family protein [Prolixibacteraceae bacterium]|nr:FecR family protein [Prolixibacteraceae bacterium]
MFRHPNSKYRKGTNDDFAFEKKIDQSIRYLSVPSTLTKEGALNMLLDRIAIAEAQTRVQGKVRHLYFTIGTVAAAACIAFVMLYSFFMVETYTGGKELAANVVYLPDHSRVVLADGAVLKHSKLFYQRNVKLKGEAYFEVESGSNFYVDTKKGGVLVIGTRFSVNDNGEAFAVDCYEGVVGVDFLREKVRISDGMHFSGKGQLFQVQKSHNFGYPEYALFSYSFENIHLHELWPVVEQYFGIDIDDQVSSSEAFSGSFHTGNVQEVIDIVCTSMKINYQVVNENEVLIQSR